MGCLEMLAAGSQLRSKQPENILAPLVVLVSKCAGDLLKNLKNFGQNQTEVRVLLNNSSSGP